MRFERRRKRPEATGFRCVNCGQFVPFAALGTSHRNHCPFCLWSKHLDTHPGDRGSTCGGAMKPIGLTFKTEGGKKQGEIMVVHHCQECGVVSKNRIAGDDKVEAILEVFKESVIQPQTEAIQAELKMQDFRLLEAKDEAEVMTQLYGKNYDLKT